MSSTRSQTNSFVPIAIPADALWGEQTELRRRYFAIGHQRMPIEIVHSLAEIKCAAAVRVAEGEFDAQFLLLLWQSG